MSELSSDRARDIGRYVNAATYEALKTRLRDRAALEWAVALSTNQEAERQAVRDLVAHADKIDGPYGAAWNWLIESWETRPLPGEAKFWIAHWIKSTGASGAAIRKLVELVRPWPEVKPLEGWQRYGGPPPPKIPRKLSDLVGVAITSGPMVRLAELGLGNTQDAGVLLELVDRLGAALEDGLHIARRLGWQTPTSDRVLWDVHRVYFVPDHSTNEGNQDADPDSHRKGFAPVTKLLHEAATKLAKVDLSLAQSRIAPWRTSTWPIFHRLWAAFARDPTIIAGVDVFGFLKESSSRAFWDINAYPEVSEVRAARFAEFNERDRLLIEKRILRLPPATMWPRKISASKRKDYRTYHAALELRRILIAGGLLSSRSEAWLSKPGMPSASDVERLDAGFPEGVVVRWGGDDFSEFTPTEPTTLLSELDSALGEDRWSDRARSADHFLRGHISEILDAMARDRELSQRVFNIWGRIGHALQPSTDDPRGSHRDAHRLVAEATQLPEPAIGYAVAGLADFASNWAKSFREDQEFGILWFRLWPLAVDATNKVAPQEPAQEVSLVGEKSSDRLAFAALNTPVGHLMTAFLALCPNLKREKHPFVRGQLREMRDLTIEASGQARLQVLHRLLSNVEYMRRADRVWTDANLLAPLRDNDPAQVELWDAVARNPVLSPASMRKVGTQMAEVARASNLSEETKAHLAERVVLRVLFDRTAGQRDSVPQASVQQMLRLGSDQLRAAVARALGIYLELKGIEKTAEDRFSTVVRPFLENDWPKEKTLRSKSLSDALAAIPAKVGERFADAIDTLEPFMTPFDCWSLWEFRLYDRDPEGKTLRPLSSKRDAEALLRLLDISIGSEEGATIPYDLDRALSAIREKDPKLEKSFRFARLSSIARG